MADSPQTEQKSQENEQVVKTIIHQLESKPQNNGSKPVAVEFVSETDVRDALAADKKIYVNKKTIITPSAKDLGEEKEIFAKI